MKWSEEIRKARGDLSRAEAAEAIGGCPVNTIRDWEQGLRTPPEWVQSLVIQKLETVTTHIDEKAMRDASPAGASQPEPQ